MKPLMTLRWGDFVVFQTADVRWIVIGPDGQVEGLPYSVAIERACRAAGRSGAAVWLHSWTQEPQQIDPATRVPVS